MDTLAKVGLAFLIIPILMIISNMVSHALKDENGSLAIRFVYLFDKEGIVLFAIPPILMLVFSMIFYASEGHSYLVQYPDGTQKAILEPGFRLKYLGRVQEYEQSLKVSFGVRVNGVSFGDMRGQKVQFNDSVTANVRMEAVFQLPLDENQFLRMANAYPTQESIKHLSLIPAMQEAMRDVAKMYSAKEYINGGSCAFGKAVYDQVLRQFGKKKEMSHNYDDDPINQFGIIFFKAKIHSVDLDPAFAATMQQAVGCCNSSSWPFALNR